jgi:formylmethanofuran dehydrogenase subunit E
LIGPAVVCVRGPSGSGKTALIERLVPNLERRGHRVAYLKRTHHLLDIPEKASGRVWASGPSAMLLRATDRAQLTLPPGDGTASSLLELVPPEIDVVLLETHSAEPFPTVLSAMETPVPGEQVLGRWGLETIDADASAAAAAIASLVPPDATLSRALRSAVRFHGGHACPGIVLGTRLALRGVEEIGVEVPDRQKRLLVTVETDRCATDAVQAVTGCRPGKRTLRILDYGKLAATFVDQHTGMAVRVASRGDLRERVGAGGEDRHSLQRLAYLRMPAEQMFTIRPVSGCVRDFDLPGPPRRRVICDSCAEEVSDAREVHLPDGIYCRPCADRVADLTAAGERKWA